MIKKFLSMAALRSWPKLMLKTNTKSSVLDPGSRLATGSRSRRGKMTQKIEKVNKFNFLNVLKCCIFSFEGCRLLQ
jgi:hypothetical protein